MAEMIHLHTHTIWFYADRSLKIWFLAEFEKMIFMQKEKICHKTG